MRCILARAVYTLALASSATACRTPPQLPPVVVRPAAADLQKTSRVIVNLRLPSFESDAQRSALIIQVREAFLRDLDSTSYRVVRAYETIPAVALEVSPAALRAIEKSSHVTSVEPDTPIALQESQ